MRNLLFCLGLTCFMGLSACKTAGFRGAANGTGSPTTPIIDPPNVKPVDPKQIFAECETTPDRKLVAALYALPQNTAQLPDFKTLTKLKTVCLKQLDVTDRDFGGGFPGIPDLFEWFALDINFQVDVPAEGDYSFTLNSDDGSLLDIDGKSVIQNDGLHEHKEASGTSHLTKGLHVFRVRYYEGPRYRIALELFWQKPGASSREYIPEALFSRPKL